MPDDRPGVQRQAAHLPEDVRRGVYALDSDLSIALLVTIQQSGTTRFSWLRQELHVPNQEIVENLGRLYDAALLERTTTGRDEGRESAYTITPLGETLLETLADPGEPEPETEPESEPNPITICDPL